jgi:hypothetical protein
MAYAPTAPVELVAPTTEEDRGQYEGELSKDGNRCGRGTCRYRTGSRYEGEWETDLQTGHGSFFSQLGPSCVGQWKDGKASGQGVITRL